MLPTRALCARTANYIHRRGLLCCRSVGTVSFKYHRMSMRTRRIWLVLALLLLASTASAVWLSQKPPVPLPPYPYPSPIQPVQDSSSASSTLTYRNNEYGFELTYPADWELTSAGTSADDFVGRLLSPANRIAIVTGVPGTGDADIDVRVLNVSSFMELEELLKLEEFYITNKKQMVLNGHNCQLLTMGGAGAYLHVYCLGRHRTYKLTFNFSPTLDELTSVEGQILSSFRVL